jgi:alcohol dehydrogenase (cytochrome c)
MTGSYDPDSNTLYWGTGNPKPTLNGRLRKGVNLYSSSILALDADSGELIWCFQFTPHDPETGAIVWEFRLPLRSTSGILTTAGGLLFVGSTAGDFWALDASSGDSLWHERMSAWIHAAPVTYEVSGRQLVSIAANTGIFTFGLES